MHTKENESEPVWFARHSGGALTISHRAVRSTLILSTLSVPVKRPRPSRNTRVLLQALLMSSPKPRRSARRSINRAKMQPSPGSPSRLPLDIVGYLCVFLWDVPTTLRAFALTCTSWHTAIRPHIFRRITLTKNNMEKLEQLLQSIPKVACWVKIVRIKGTPYDHRRDLTGPGIDPNETWMYGAFKLFEKLQRVQHVEVSYIQPSTWDDQELKVVLPLLAASNSLRSFTFTECRLPRRVVHGFIRSLIHVPDLHFHDAQYKAPQLATPFLDEELRPPCPSKIERLCVHNSGGFSFSEVQPIFESINPHQHIRTLHMHIDNRLGLPEIAKLLPIVGPNLHHFELGLSPQMGFGSTNEEELGGFPFVCLNSGHAYHVPQRFFVPLTSVTSRNCAVSTCSTLRNHIYPSFSLDCVHPI